MKKILTIVTAAFISCASAQTFGTDVVANSTNDQRKMESVVAFNGWIYTASYILEPSGQYRHLNIMRSTDGGANWQLLVDNQIASGNVPDFDLEVMGSTAGTLKINFVYALFSSLTGEYSLIVERYDGNTGVYLDTPLNQTTGASPIRSVSLASDNNFPSTTSSTGGFVTLAYAVGSTLSDEIFVRYSNNGGNSYSSDIQAVSTSGYLREFDLAYGRGASSTEARFYLAYEVLSSPSSFLGQIYYTHEDLSIAFNPWVTPISLSTDPSLSGFCRNPRISVQQSTTDNSSGSNTVVVLTEVVNTDSDIVSFVNLAPQTTNTWFRIDVDASPDYYTSPDISYDRSQERFVMTQFNYSTGSLEVSGISRNILPSDSYLPLAANVNDLGLNTLLPKTRILAITGMNKIGVSWIDEGPTGLGEIHFDREGISASLAESTTPDLLSISPNPTSDMLTVELCKEFEIKSIKIMDMNGNEVLDLSELAKGVNTVDVSFLATGIYLIQTESTKGFVTNKFAKE